MAILICAASPQEMTALAPGLFPDPEAVPQMRPMKTVLKNRELIFLVTGIGIINAAFAIGVTLGMTFDQKTEKSGVESMLYAGLAGAYDLNTHPLCSIWQIEEEIWPEYGLNDGQTVTARAFRFPQWKNDREEIYDRVRLASYEIFERGKKAADWPKCASLTVAGVSASFDRREKLWNKYRVPLENMEGFAAGYAALRAGVPCVEIRSVSNKIGPRRKDEKDFDRALQALGEILPALNLI